MIKLIFLFHQRSQIVQRVVVCFVYILLFRNVFDFISILTNIILIITRECPVTRHILEQHKLHNFLEQSEEISRRKIRFNDLGVKKERGNQHKPRICILQCVNHA